MRNLALFTTVVVVAYVVGKHLIPSAAVDIAIGWVLGLFSLSAGSLVLA